MWTVESKEVKGVKYMVSKGALTLGGEHTIPYTGDA